MFFREEKDWWSADRADLARQCNKKETAHIIRVADETLNDTFVFDMEWDLEQTKEPVVFSDGIDFEYNPGNDPEFVWQFNRHQFLICLSQAYRLTGDERYVRKMVSVMEQFMETQRDYQNKRTTTFRILEIGMRSGNWLKALYTVGPCNLLTDEFLNKVRKFLKLHGDIIKAEHNPYCYAGNWGILENHGLFLLGVLLGEEQYTKQAIQVLDKALKTQVLPDGMQLEQSIMYHNEILRVMLDVLYYGLVYEVEIPESMRQKVFDMLYMGLNFRKSDGHQIAMGDSDDMDISRIYQIAAVIFENSVFKWAGGEEITYDNAWMLSAADAAKYKKMKGEKPLMDSMLLEQSGHYFFRSGWDRKMNMLHMDGGFLGTSHGHNDALHVDLIIQGRDVLIDPGRYTYVYGKERMEFRGTRAHNTIMVDGKEINEWENSWFTKTVTAQSRQQMYKNGRYTFASAGHMGYMRLKNPVFCNRKVIGIDNEVFVLIDECFTSGIHSYTHNLHFSNEGSLKLQGKKAIFENSGVKSCILLDPRAFIERYESKQSLHYNQYVDNVSLSMKYRKTGFHSAVTVIMEGDDERNAMKLVSVKSYVGDVTLEDSMATGIELIYKNKKYIIIAGHAEMTAPVSIYQVGDCMACGNVIIFDMEEDTGGTVLNW